MRITRDEFPELKPVDTLKIEKSDPEPEQQHSLHLDEKPISSAEIKKQIAILVDETLKQLADINKNEKDIEDVYLIFKGQMMVINKCRLLSVKEQQKQNAEVYACYYKRKFEFKKATLKLSKNLLAVSATSYPAAIVVCDEL